MLLVDAPSRARLDAAAARLARVDGVARTATAGQAGGRALVITAYETGLVVPRRH